MVLPIELLMLALSVALLFVLVLIQASAGTSALGPDERWPTIATIWVPCPYGRRAPSAVVDNHREGLIMFAPLVLIAAQTRRAHLDDRMGRAALLLLTRRPRGARLPRRLADGRPLFWSVGIIGHRQ